MDIARLIYGGCHRPDFSLFRGERESYRTARNRLLP